MLNLAYGVCYVTHIRRGVCVCVCVCLWVCLRVLTLRARVCICGEFDVVAGKQTLPPVELPFPPITVVLVEHCDHLTLLESQLVIVLGNVVVHADHLTHSCETRDPHDGQAVSSVMCDIYRRWTIPFFCELITNFAPSIASFSSVFQSTQTRFVSTVLFTHYVDLPARGKCNNCQTQELTYS